MDFPVNQSIPDDNAVGIADSRLITTEIVSITSLSVLIAISGGFNGDLYAHLIHDSGFVVLLNRVGRTATLDSFIGLDPNGEWTLFIADVNSGGAANLVSWGMVIEGAVPESSSSMLWIMGASLLLLRRKR